MPESVKTWTNTLNRVRSSPALALGSDSSTAYLQRAAGDPLRLLWDKGAFADPVRGWLRFGPTQYHVWCECGTLDSNLEALLMRGSGDILVQELLSIGLRVPANASWWGRYDDPTLPIGSFAGPLMLAERGVVAVRVQAGLWCQTYRQGWPVCEPVMLDSGSSSTGLMVAAALAPPAPVFTREAVEGVIPEAARPFVELEWHEEDELVPACVPDPACVLDPANVHRWL